MSKLEHSRDSAKPVQGERPAQRWMYNHKPNYGGTPVFIEEWRRAFKSAPACHHPLHDREVPVATRGIKDIENFLKKNET